MHPFSYVAPKSMDEALKVLSQSEGLVKPLVGGTDLIDQIKQNRKSPSVVLDTKHIPEMMRLEYSVQDGLHIGSAVPCTDTAAHPQVAKLFTALYESCQLIGSTQIQNRASVGGNICNAAPSADTVPGLICYSAKEVILSPRGRREVPLEEFFKGPGEHHMEQDELLLETVVPTPPPNSSCHYLRFIPRNEMDIAVAGVATLLALKPNTRICTQARISLASVAPTPIRATDAEKFLEGKEITEDLIIEASKLAVGSASPISDVRGSAAYRKQLIKVLTQRTIMACMQSLGQAF